MFSLVDLLEESNFNRDLVINYPIKMTYEELDIYSKKVISLSNEYKTQYIPILTERRYEIIGIIFGVLRSNKGYCPIDSRSPILTQLEIIESLNPDVLIVDNTNLEKLKNVTLPKLLKIINIDDINNYDI